VQIEVEARGEGVPSNHHEVAQGQEKQWRVGIIKWSKGQELLVMPDGPAEVQVLRKEEH